MRKKEWNWKRELWIALVVVVLLVLAEAMLLELRSVGVFTP